MNTADTLKQWSRESTAIAQTVVAKVLGSGSRKTSDPTVIVGSWKRVLPGAPTSAVLDSPSALTPLR